MANRPETSVLSYLRDARFAVLLFLLGALMLAAPFIGAVDVRSKSGLAEIGLGILFVSMLMSAAQAAAQSRVNMVVAWCLLAPLIVIWIIDDAWSETFFYKIIHPGFMLIALAVAHVGLVLAKRRNDDRSNMLAGGSFILALVLITAAIPWDRL